MAGRDPPQAWGPVWALRLTVACVLLGISGGGSRPLSEGPPGPPVGEATMDISLLHQADSEMDMSPEMVLGTLPDHCRPPSSRCQSFLGDLRVRLQSRFHLLLLGNRHPWPLCQELCDTWLASCETDPACTPAWLSITGSRLCPAGCRTYAKLFPDGADVCRWALGPALPMAPPGSQRCLNISTSAQDSTLLRVSRRARAWIPDGAGSASGSGSGGGP